jgi:hypothetical protein
VYQDNLPIPQTMRTQQDEVLHQIAEKLNFDGVPLCASANSRNCVSISFVGIVTKIEGNLKRFLIN